MSAPDLLLAALFALVALGGTAVVLTRDPRRQLLVAGVFGLLLAALFHALGAPDVALSEIVVGTVVIPLLVVATLIKLEKMK
jgi:uncharacterized MnhB-related membrane protein